MEHEFAIENGVLLKYRGPGGDVAIPEGVTRVGSEAFSGCAGLEHIKFPERLETIGDFAFAGCRGLTEPVFPKGLRAIEYCAFSDCTGLERLTLPEGLAALGEFAFSGCRNITELALPAGLARIDRSAFSRCRGLVSAALPEALEHLEQSVFFGCAKLREVWIPKSLRSADVGAFTGCDSLTRISVAPENPYLKDVDGLVYAKDGTRLLICPGGLQEASIPAGVTEIGPRAFYKNRNLDTVTLPSTLQTIGAEAFSGCAALAELALPEGLRGIGEAAFADCRELKRLRIPDSVTEIADSAFRGCTGLRWLALPAALPFDLHWFAAPHDPPCFSADRTVVPFASTRRIEDIGSDMGTRRAALGLIRAEADGVAIAEDIARGYTDYLRENVGLLWEEMLSDDDILRWMAERGMIPRADVEPLLERATERGSASAAALLLDYQNRVTLQTPAPGGELETRFAALENALDF